METIVVVGLVILVVLAIFVPKHTSPELSEDDLRVMKLGEQQVARDRSDTWQYGPRNKAMVCPHCQTKGEVRTRAKKVKKGISGTKAAGAVITGGVSILATGLSRREGVTSAHCGNCHSTWEF